MSYPVPSKGRSGGPAQRRSGYFLLHNSALNKVMDVSGNNREPGANVIIYDMKTPYCDNQLWYMDDDGCIRSKLNGFYLDTTSGDARLMPYNMQSACQKWTYNAEDQAVRNQWNYIKVLDVGGWFKLSKSKVIEKNWEGGQNQRWELRYVDL